jgi:Transglutaminase-like superfamily
MKKYLLIIFLISFIFIFNKSVNAFEDFNINLKSTYTFNDDGISNVTDTFEIENKYTEKYLPSFEYTINNITAYDIKVSENGNDLKYVKTDENQGIDIKVNFSDKILGKGKLRKVYITYSVSDIFIRTGDIREISIPKIDSIDSYQNVDLTLLIPISYGNEAYITPNYQSKETGSDYFKYTFDKNSLLSSRIVAAFGEYQIFSFSINYHLVNNLAKGNTENVSIPMDTSYQRVIYGNIDPLPKNIVTDTDGNWIAQFYLPAKNNIDIKVTGNVQLFAVPRKYLIPEVDNLYDNIKSSQYWESGSDEIKLIAQKLNTPEDVYKFVVGTLNYDYSLSKKERLGALKSLKTTENVTCREYSDLMITILRAKGIPAREIVGYAYTDNPDTKPISFFNDVLHSWVEYWDVNKNIWVSVDPTWGETSNSDYFNQFDLRHFAFTIHGTNSVIPFPPGSYSSNGYEKDIFISFGDNQKFTESPIFIEKPNLLKFPFTRKISLNLKNNNSHALYGENVKYFLNNKLVSEDNYKVVPPFSEINKSLSSKFSFLGSNTPENISVSINGKTSEFTGPKNTDTYFQLILIFLIFIIIIVYIARKLIFYKLLSHQK